MNSSACKWKDEKRKHHKFCMNAKHGCDEYSNLLTGQDDKVKCLSLQLEDV